MAGFDLNKFLEVSNAKLFHGRATASQRAGMARIISTWNKHQPEGTDAQLAYVLATSYWETGRRMQPVFETYADSRAHAASRLQHAFDRGQLPWVRHPYWHKFRGIYWVGAGDVQLTGYDNYHGKMRDAVKAEFGYQTDIGASPDKVMDPEISAFIMIYGMMQGTFTGQKLGKFVQDQAEISSYRAARAVVNPGDRTSYSPIANAALDFYAALQAGRGIVVITWTTELVKGLQRDLLTLGYAQVGVADGIIGPKTKRAVQQFRQHHNLPKTPIFDAALLKSVAKALS